MQYQNDLAIAIAANLAIDAILEIADILAIATILAISRQQEKQNPTVQVHPLPKCVSELYRRESNLAISSSLVTKTMYSI